MNKTCRKCNVKLVIGKNITQSYLNNSDYSCKVCRKLYRREWVKDNSKHKEYQAQWKEENYEHKLKLDRQYYQDKKDGIYSVYITKDNYAGVTGNIYDRANHHKRRKGNISPFLCVIHQTDCEYDASELEDLLHDIGYKGKHKTNKPYWANVS